MRQGRAFRLVADGAKRTRVADCHVITVEEPALVRWIEHRRLRRPVLVEFRLTAVSAERTVVYHSKTTGGLRRCAGAARIYLGFAAASTSAAATRSPPHWRRSLTPTGNHAPATTRTRHACPSSPTTTDRSDAAVPSEQGTGEPVGRSPTGHVTPPRAAHDARPVDRDVHDLQRHRSRTRGHWRNENRGHGQQSSISPPSDQEATRNLDLNNEALPAALI